MSSVAEYRLPPVFYADHVERALPAGRLLRELSRSVVVELDGADFDELLADARYYSEEMGEAGFDGVGLISSARATVRALERQGRPAGPATVEQVDDVPLVEVPAAGRRIRSYDRHATRRKAERELAELLLCRPLEARLVRTGDAELPWAIEVADR